jgi:hypothetical protein
MSLTKKCLIALFAVLALSASSFALEPGWNYEGTIERIFIGAPGQFDATSNSVVVFFISNPGATPTMFTYAFYLDGTPLSNGILAQLYAAKTNGWNVQTINAAGTIGVYQKLARIVAY